VIWILGLGLNPNGLRPYVIGQSWMCAMGSKLYTALCEMAW